MENTIETNVRDNHSPYFNLLFAKRYFIIVFTLIFAIFGFCYAKFVEKPTYRASRAVILRTVVGDLGVDSSISYEASLAKIYLPIVKDIILSSSVISAATEEYQQTEQTTGGLKAGSVQVAYGEKSMIFTMAYTDVSPELAEKKLDALIQVASEIVPEGVEAEVVSLIPTQNDCNISESRSFVKLIALFTILGAVLVIGFYSIAYLMDNTVKTKSELEEITGASVLAQIESYENK